METKRNLLTYSKPLSLLILILFLVTAVKVNATNYYIAANGDDGANGTTPSTAWQSISKFNNSSSLFTPGTTVYFNKGDVFDGTINVPKSGASGSPITLSAYGTGAKPIITGFKTLTTWTNEGGGIYSATITTSILTNMVTIDGKQVGMGRYPDLSFLTYESFATTKSITDNGLGTSTNWTGAGLAIRKNDWTLDRAIITNHTGDVLTYTNLGSTQTPASSGFGYFFMNDLKTLTTYGEWYHNPVNGKFYMYFGTVDPTTKIVQVALLSNLINNSTGYDYINIDNLNLKGAIIMQ